MWKRTEGAADGEALDELRAEIAEASRTADFRRAKRLQRRLRKMEKRAGRRPSTSARVVENRDSTRGIVPYDLLHRDGVIRVDDSHYAIALEADDVNYIGARAAEQEDVRILWADWLNGLDAGLEVGISVCNRQIGTEEFLESLAFAPVAGDDEGNALREEYNGWCREKLMSSSRSMRRTRTVVIRCEAPVIDKASPLLHREAERFVRLMRDLESDARIMDGQDVMDAVCAWTHPADAPGTIRFEQAADSPDLTTRDLVAPSSVLRVDEFRGDSRLVVGGRWVKSYEMLLDGYGTTMRDSFVADLTSLPYDIGVSWHIRPWLDEAAISAAENHLFNVTEENNAYKLQRSRPERGFFIDEDTLPPRMREAQDEAEAYRKDLVRNNMRNFGCCTVVTVMADDAEQLEAACKDVEAVFSSHRKPIPDSWAALREQAFTATLPIGVCEVPFSRTLTTLPLSHMLMFASSELMDTGGMLMGVNPQTRNFISYDPVRYEHSNSFVIAQTGSGKSMNVKLTRIIQTALRHPGDDVIVIDPDNEYSEVAGALGGQIVNIAETSPDLVNPLDISVYYGSDDPGAQTNPVPAKVSFIQTLVHMMSSSVTSAQANLLDWAAKMAYAEWQRDPGPDTVPTLQDIYDLLLGVEGQSAGDAQDLAKTIWRFVEGTLSVFNGRTNVELRSHLVDFVLSDLSTELKPIAMLIVLDHIWVRVSANRQRGRRTWLIVDEFQLLLDDEMAVDKFDRMFTRGRKWDLYNCAITQNISRVLDNQSTRYMLQNCPFLAILGQSPDAARELADLLSLSQSQERLLRTASPGQGLYVLKNACVPFDFTISPRSCPRLYAITTTRPGDIKPRDASAPPAAGGGRVPSRPEPDDAADTPFTGRAGEPAPDRDPEPVCAAPGNVERAEAPGAWMSAFGQAPEAAEADIAVDAPSAAGTEGAVPAWKSAFGPAADLDEPEWPEEGAEDPTPPRHQPAAEPPSRPPEPSAPLPGREGDGDNAGRQARPVEPWAVGGDRRARIPPRTPAREEADGAEGADRPEPRNRPAPTEHPAPQDRPAQGEPSAWRLRAARRPVKAPSAATAPDRAGLPAEAADAPAAKAPADPPRRAETEAAAPAQGAETVPDPKAEEAGELAASIAAALAGNREFLDGVARAMSADLLSAAGIDPREAMEVASLRGAPGGPRQQDGFAEAAGAGEKDGLA